MESADLINSDINQNVLMYIQVLASKTCMAIATIRLLNNKHKRLQNNAIQCRARSLSPEVTISSIDTEFRNKDR